MEAEVKSLIERRKQKTEKIMWWERLSLAQKFSVSSLGKFGYELQFIRFQNGEHVAVLSCESGLAVVTQDGDINTRSSSKVR